MNRTAEDRSPRAHLDPRERDLEAPVEDLLEQATDADQETDEETDEDLAAMTGEGTGEAGEYDVLEQARPVYLDEDAYR